MTNKGILALAVFLTLRAPAYAHRLDEYLQATMLSVEKDRMDGFMRLVPGVAVSSKVLALIDTNGDGVISENEQRSYAEHVLRDLSLSVDGKPLARRLISVDFPAVEQIKDGLGQIQIQFSADLPAGGPDRKLDFENRHQKSISVYLMNCLVPHDPSIRIVAQNRNENQSLYRLEYTVANPGSTRQSSRTVGFASIYRLGIRHIAEGTDHLLFLLALLLPAPLAVTGSRWAEPTSVRHSTLKILKVVTAFTVGHSITLALAGLGLVRVPSRPIEILIALSILISAVHALRPLFPGKEAGLACFFGLIHGLAFASSIVELGLGRWERVLSILAFNLGIETIQLVVVVATLPSLLLLSRTPVYVFFRTGGALFAGLAAAGWISERLLGIRSAVDGIVGSVAHFSVWMAAALSLSSVVCWWSYNSRQKLHEATNNRHGLPSTEFLDDAGLA